MLDVILSSESHTAANYRHFLDGNTVKRDFYGNNVWFVRGFRQQCDVYKRTGFSTPPACPCAGRSSLAARRDHETLGRGERRGRGEGGEGGVERMLCFFLAMSRAADSST